MRIAYIILGSVWILFLSSTEVKGECTKPITTENAVIHEDDIVKETFADQDKVKLACHPGYEPRQGSPMRLTCMGDKWSPPPERFTCQKKTCGNPGDVMYGKYEYLSGNEFGDIIQPQCNLGYYLLGSPDQQRVCMANGEWDGQEPVCEVIKCGAPPDITNGRPKFPPEDEYEYNHVVEYVCDAGTLLGDSSIRCLLNTSWSNAPQCKVVNCPKRPDIPNAERIGGNSGPYGYMATLTYGCVKGFRMAAGSTGTVVCKEMGWTHTLVCEEIICPQVQPTNATITEGAVGPYRPGSIISYRCQDGYTLVGRSTLECRLNGQWSSDPPMCKEIICPQVQPTNATITKGAVGPYRPGSIIRYRCQDGDTLVGRSTLECRLDGQWSSDPPMCKEIICPSVKPTNATITERVVGPYRPGSIIHYRCHDGQTLAGSSTLNCQSDGQWSSGPPVCKVVTCAEPKNTNAVIESGAGGPYTVNWVLKYGCLNKMHLSGKHQLTCQSDGSWSSEPPVCEDKPMPLWKKVLIAILIILIIILVAILVWWFCFRKKKNCHNDRAPKRERVKLNSHSSPESV